MYILEVKGKSHLKNQALTRPQPSFGTPDCFQFQSTSCGLFNNPWRIFLNCLVLWAQDGDTTRPLTDAQVSAVKRHTWINVGLLVCLLHFWTCIKVRPFSCFHQVFVSDSKEFLSVVLLHHGCDSTEEMTHSYKEYMKHTISIFNTDFQHIFDVT